MRKPMLAPPLLAWLLCLLTSLSGFASAQTLSVQSLTLAPSTLVGGATSIATITLSASPTVDTYVNLETTNAALASGPNVVFVAANSSPTFTTPIGTALVNSNQTVTLEAFINNGTARQYATLTLTTGFARSFAPTNDVYVQSGTNANNNYQSLDPDNLLVKRDGIVSNVDRAAHLQFDLTNLHAAPASAWLQLSALTHANGGNMSVTCFAAANTQNDGMTAWTEGNLTANNAPNLSLSDFTHTPSNDPTLDQQPLTAYGGLICFNLTNFIASHLGQIVSVQLMETGINPASAEFAGKEASSGQPSLVMTFTGINSDVPLPGWAEDALAMDSAGTDGEGPSSADGVVLASGVYENTPDPDIVVRNPSGPDVVYARRYRSAQAAKGYGTPGLSVGWMDNYDLKIAASNPSGWNPLILLYPNGAAETLTPIVSGGVPTGAFSVPMGSPYLASGVASGTVGQWTSVSLKQKDESTLTFTQSGTPNTLILNKITNLVGSYISINQNANNSVASIKNSDSPTKTLLNFVYLGTTTGITDYYGRTVTLTFSGNPFLLTGVSIVGGTALRWQYGYSSSYGEPYLISVTAPDPNGSGNGDGHFINYDAGMRVPALADANGNQHVYSYGGNTGVNVTDNNGISALSWTQLLSFSNLDAGTLAMDKSSTSVQYDMTANLYQPLNIANELGQAVSLTYDPASAAPIGNVKTITEPTSAGGQLVTTYTYDYSPTTGFGLGRLLSVQPSGQTATSFSYYSNGLVHTMQTPMPGTQGTGAQVTTTYTYSAIGNVLTITTPGPNDNVVITYNYTHDPYQNVNKTEALGEPLTITDPLLNVTHLRYDSRGNVTAAIDASLNETDYQYDSADDLTEVIYPPSVANSVNRAYVIYSYAYPGGPMTASALYSEKAPPYDNSVLAFRTVLRTADNEDADKTVSGGVPTVNTTFDPLYRLGQLLDGNPVNTGQIPTQYTYDPLGNLVQTTFPKYVSGNADRLQAGYDMAHSLTSRVDGLGRTTTYQRNNTFTQDDSITGITYPVGTLPNVSYLYDNYGRVSDSSDGVLPNFTSYHLHYDYDDLDNINDVITTYKDSRGNLLPAKTVSYFYNPDGSRQKMTTPAGDYIYAYWDNGLLKSVTFPWGQTVSYTYYPNNWLNTQTQTKFTTTYLYNGRGFLSDLSNKTSTNVFLSEFGPGITYDAAGNRLNMPINMAPLAPGYDASGVIAYQYDTRDTLIDESCLRPNDEFDVFGPPGIPLYNRTYEYMYQSDAADNLVMLRSFTQTPNIDNQTTSNNQTYDGNGNPDVAAVWYNTGFNNYGAIGLGSLSFDVENRLTQVSSGITTTMTYRDDGLRASFNGSSHTFYTFYVYDGVQVVAELNSDGSLAAAYGYGANGLVQRYDGSHYTAYTFDPMGNTVSRYRQQDPLGQPSDIAVYDAFGNLGDNVYPSQFYPSFPPDPVGFGGQWGYYTDVANGLVLCGLRYYDPIEGVFLTRDPISYEGGMNLYAYAGNNPINHFDPMGTDDDDDFPVDASGHARPYRKAMHKLHQYAVVANKAITMVADLHPFSPLAKAWTGKDSRGKTLSPGARAFEVVMAVLPAMSAIPKFTGMGNILETQVAAWLGRKGASVVTDPNVLSFSLGVGEDTVFDGAVGKLLYEVKSKLNTSPVQVADNIKQFTRQAAIAKREGYAYRIFIKGGIPRQL